MKRLLFLLAPLFLILFSCSQNLPELSAVSGTSVFEFESENDHPVMKLSVFIDVSSDVHRAAGLRLECLQNDYKWECENPLKFESGKKKYAGYTDFVMPGNKPFPAGRYILWYIDSNGNEDSTVLNINYQSDILQMTPKEAAAYCGKNEGVENWAVFDGDSVLLHYGEKGDNLNPDDLWGRYPKAESIKTVWALKKELLVFPAVYKKEVKDTENESGNNERGFEGERNGIDFAPGGENLRSARGPND